MNLRWHERLTEMALPRVLSVILTAMYLLFPFPKIVNALPIEMAVADFKATDPDAVTAPYDTPLARFCQQNNDWHNSTANDGPSLGKRMNHSP